MNTAATYEAVLAAIEELEASDRKPTIDAIRGITGGNKGTIISQRNRIYASRAAQPDNRDGDNAGNDTLVNGVAKIVQPVAAHLADIAPAVAGALKRTLDAEREANRHVVEAILADHGRELAKLKELLEVQAAASTEIAAEFESCENEKAALESHVPSLTAEVERLQAEIVTIGSEKYAVSDRAAVLADRLAEAQGALVTAQDKFHQIDQVLVECRLKNESMTLALEVSQNELAVKNSKVLELQNQLEELGVRYIGLEKYAQGVTDALTALKASIENRLDQLLRTFASAFSKGL